jgi:hypothetical protein
MFRSFGPKWYKIKVTHSLFICKIRCVWNLLKTLKSAVCCRFFCVLWWSSRAQKKISKKRFTIHFSLYGEECELGNVLFVSCFLLHNHNKISHSLRWNTKNLRRRMRKIFLYYFLFYCLVVWFDLVIFNSKTDLDRA